MSDSVMNMYRCTPREAKRFTSEDILPAGLVPFWHSSPGMGKSALMHEISNDYNLHMIDHRLSTSSPEDLSGLPCFEDRPYEAIDEKTGETVIRTHKVATFAPFDTFPIETTKIPYGKDGFFLFLDEANSAEKPTQAAAYKLVLDKMTGQHKLHPNTAIAMAGNLSTDRAIVEELSTAMRSRVVHIELELNFREFMRDVAYRFNWDDRITAYLEFKGLPALMDFDPDRDEKTFACPRTWEFMNKLIRGKAVTEEKAKLYKGTITSGLAADFVTFTSVHGNLPKFRDVVGDPQGTWLPADPPSRFMTVTSLVTHVEEDTFDQVAEYVGRLNLDFRVIFYRSLMVRKPHLRQHQAFRKAMGQLSSYLYDDADDIADANAAA